jgi:hypothetical protein
VSRIEFADVVSDNEVVAAQIKDAERAAEPTAVKVRVCRPYRVLHEGVAFIAGETLDIPNDQAQLWIRSGWVEPVSLKGKK